MIQKSEEMYLLFTDVLVSTHHAFNVQKQKPVYHIPLTIVGPRCEEGKYKAATSGSSSSALRSLR